MDASASPPPVSPPNAPRGRLINVSMWIILIPTVMVVAARIYSKLSTAKRLISDDALIVAAFLCCIAQSIAIVKQVESGFGSRESDLSDGQRMDVLKDNYVSQVFYVLSIYLTKLSTLSWFYRLCSKKFHFRTVEVVAGVSALSLLAGLITVLFQCQVPATWDILSGKCINLDAFWTVNLIVDVTSQVAISLLPILLLRSLNVADRSKKWLSMLAFIPNFLAIPLAILRLVYLYQAFDSDDYLYDLYNATLLSGLHAFVAVMVASLPFVKVVIDSLIIQPYLIDDNFSVRPDYNNSSLARRRNTFLSRFRRTGGGSDNSKQGWSYVTSQNGRMESEVGAPPSVPSVPHDGHAKQWSDAGEVHMDELGKNGVKVTASGGSEKGARRNTDASTNESRNGEQVRDGSTERIIQK